MASFLPANQVQQFASYIPQIDPNSYAQTQEVYRHAILQKQSQYEQGVARVQNSYDTVAGLKMGRQQDTDYLNQKLQGLQTQFQKLAGGDFSQQAVVNQAAGYASQIYSDQRVQNAAMSAQNASDAASQIQQAHKDGKAAASNDNLILRNLTAWQNGDENATLGKQTYNPYYNYNKSWQDFISKVHPNVIIEETPNDEKSPYGVAYTLNQGKKEYLTAGQLQQTFKTFLQTDNQAAQQIQTDALYYSDKTPDNVAIQNINANYQNQINQIDVAIKRVEENKAIFTSSDDLARLDQQKEQLSNQRDLLSMNLNRGVYEQQYLKNPEQGKMNLFQSNLIQGIANVYAYDITENKTVKNPLLDALVDQDRLSIALGDAKLRQSEFDLKVEQFKYKQTSEGRDAQGNLTATTTPVVAPPTPEQFITQTNQMGEQLAQQQLKMLYDTGNMESLVRLGTDANGNAKYFLQNGRTQQDFHNTLNNVTAAYRTDPNSAKASVKAYFSTPENPTSGVGLENTYWSTQKAIDNTEKQLQERFRDDPAYIRYTNNIKSLGDLNKVVSQEGNVTITNDDLLKVAKAGGLPYIYNTEKVSKATGLPPEKVALIYKKVTGDSGSFTQDVVNEFVKPIVSGFQVYGDRATGSDRNVKMQYDKYISAFNDSDKYREARIAAYKPKLEGLMPIVSSSESTAGENGKGVQDDLARIQSIVAVGRDSEKNGLAAVMADPGAKTRSYSRNPDGSYYVTVNSSKNSVTIPLSPNQIPNATGLTQPNPNAVIETDLRNSRPVNGASTTTTNYYYPNQFQNNLQSYQIQAKYRDNGQGQVTPLIEYHQVGSNTWIPLPESIYFPSIDQAKNYFNQIAANGDEYFVNTFLKK